MISRHFALIDKDRNLWLTPARRSTPKFEKLGTMAHSIAFHDTTNMLSAMLDSKFIVWYHPSAIYVDKGIFTRARFMRPAELVSHLLSHFIHQDFNIGILGKHLTLCHSSKINASSEEPTAHFSKPSINMYHFGYQLTLISISPYPTVLHEHVASRKWDDAVRLCRFVKDPSLWACLAVMAAEARHLNTTEVCFAAVDEVCTTKTCWYSILTFE